MQFVRDVQEPKKNRKSQMNSKEKKIPILDQTVCVN